MALGLYELINNINKQIKSICCKIENLDPGGGGGVNIYNSDGTLTGTRLLEGNNNALAFKNLITFATLDNSFGANGINLDFSTQEFYFGALSINNQTTLLIDDTNQLIKTSNQGNDIGLYIDFANGIYTFGNGSVNSYLQINTGSNESYLLNGLVDIGQTNVLLSVWDSFNIIKTQYQGNDIGLTLDFAGNNYLLGNYTGNIAGQLSLAILPNLLYIYDSFSGITNFIIQNDGSINNEVKLNIQQDGLGELINTKYQGNDIGLKLDFAHDVYFFGDTSNTKAGYFSTTINGFDIVADNSLFPLFSGTNFNLYLGDFGYNFNGTSFFINDSTQIIKTSNQGNDIGLKLDFANDFYLFGNINLGNYLELNSGNSLITLNGGNILGLEFDYISKQYRFGHMDVDNRTFFSINDITSIIKTSYQNNDTGLKLDFANSIYQFGQLAVGNTTYLSIDDSAAYPVQLTGTNISSGTAGSSSGQFLKIKVGGVDYKIALLNP